MAPKKIILLSVSLCLLAGIGVAYAQSQGTTASPPDASPRNSVLTNTKALPLPEQPPPAPKSEPKPKSNDVANPTKKIYVAPELSERPNPASNIILPPLYGWSRVVIKDLKMPDEGLVTDCGMKKDMIFHFFVERLREGGIPLVNEAQNDTLLSDVVTVEAEPQIISMQDLVINCISWIQYKVSVQYTFRVPPLMYRRKVPIMLWYDGMMVSSAKSTHNGALINGFIDLAMRFRNAWDKQHASVDPETLK
ncbi:MAG: hypothetical protein SFW65_06535 [Alphaproteobacteria bacterium]|nr:hypothetical protein [Alphaproteobacteria bacterium]